MPVVDDIGTIMLPEEVPANIAAGDIITGPTETTTGAAFTPETFEAARQHLNDHFGTGWVEPTNMAAGWRYAVEVARPVVEIDLAGAPLAQVNLDFLHDRICGAIATEDTAGGVDILIKRVPTAQPVPRLIADTGGIYELLVWLIREREQR